MVSLTDIWGLAQTPALRALSALSKPGISSLSAGIANTILRDFVSPIFMLSCKLYKGLLQTNPRPTIYD